PSVLVAAHPTRGLDVDAAAAVHHVLFELREAGTAIVLISESLDELLAVADRVAVMHRGRMVGERTAEAAAREEIGLMMAGAAGLPWRSRWGCGTSARKGSWRWVRSPRAGWR